MESWRSRLAEDALPGRAILLRAIREYFFQHNVLEVTTPTVGSRGVTDSQIENIKLEQQGHQYYLQTSPEYAMKRLLASGSGSIYQICPAYRGSELGRYHNMEFTMLEWYRTDFTLSELMQDVKDLLCFASASLKPSSASSSENIFNQLPSVAYKDLFGSNFSINPHAVSSQELKELVDANGIECSHILNHADNGSRSDYLDILFSTIIEPQLVSPTIVLNYPVCQAALAQVGDVDGDTVARRFEVFVEGLELANGYLELKDAAELENRMNENNRLRSTRGKETVLLDEKLLAALPFMPNCAGIALGLDRLLMVLLGKKSLSEVLTFTTDYI